MPSIDYTLADDSDWLLVSSVKSTVQVKSGTALVYRGTTKPDKNAKVGFVVAAFETVLNNFDTPENIYVKPLNTGGITVAVST